MKIDNPAVGRGIRIHGELKAALDALVGAHRAKFEPLSEHRAVKNFQTLDPGGGGGGSTRGQKAGAHRGRNSEFEHPHRRHRPCGCRRWTTALQFALPDKARI